MSAAGSSPSRITATHAARASAPPSSSTAASATRVVTSTPPDEHDVRVSPDPAVYRFAEVGAIPSGRLQLGQSVIDQVVTDVRPQRDRRAPARPARRELDRPTCNRLLGPSGPTRDPLHDVAVLVAGRERHLGVEAGRIASRSTASIRLWSSTNVRHSICAMARRLVMLFAITTWVSARR